MTSLDLKIPSKVTSVIEKYGVLAVFLSESSSFNPSTGSVAARTEIGRQKVSPPANLVIYDKISGLRRQTGYVMLAAKNSIISPQKGMIINIGEDQSYVVESVEVIRSGDLIAAWKILFESPVN